jgi:DNA-3-methyladenine glycosylase II
VSGETFDLPARGPYSLTASARFLEGFAPAAQAPAESDHTHWAFAADDGVSHVGVCLQARGDGVALEVFGGVGPAVRDQVRRILSLDGDGIAFAAVGDRDPAVGRLRERLGSLRPVLFFTPYEAAAWAVISHRVRLRQAAGVKQRLQQELGAEIAIHGERRFAFPSPERVLASAALPGLPALKAERLWAVAEAAASGRLDAAQLRALPADEAIAQLKSLPGIGDFYAQLILIRGVGSPDFLPTAESRLLRAVGLAYDIEAPSQADVERIAESWRPFRSWVAFLLRVSLETETNQVAHGPHRKPVWVRTHSA